MSYCGVNAHFQNGIVEHHISDLQEQTKTSMLYAMKQVEEDDPHLLVALRHEACEQCL